jgi:RNA polymerase sigma-70 factor (ECF subfamily)
VTRGEEFEELRSLLFAIAYRILGSVSEAEDAVQETWLRYQAAPAQPRSAKAFLSAVVTRISIDVLRSARVRREEYVGQWLPEPLLTDPYQDPERSAELADSVSMAALLLLERLSPLERAIFVLREVFGFGFPEVASAVGRSEAASSWSGTVAARPRSWPGPSSAPIMSPGYLPRPSPGSSGST